MKHLVEFPSENGEAIFVEVDEQPSGGPVTRGLSSHATIERAKVTFEEALSKAQPVAATLVNKLKSLEPDETTIEFGLVLSAEVGVILTAASSTMNYKVTLKWCKAKTEGIVDSR